MNDSSSSKKKSQPGPAGSAKVKSAPTTPSNQNKPKTPSSSSTASSANNPTATTTMKRSLSPNAGAAGAAGRGDIILSQNKVRAIMKSSPEVEHVGNDALHLITKATELFIHHMASRAIHQAGKGSKSLEYKQLSEAVRQDPSLDFLREIIPTKIPARQALQEIAKRKTQDNKFLLE